MASEKLCLDDVQSLLANKGYEILDIDFTSCDCNKGLKKKLNYTEHDHSINQQKDMITYRCTKCDKEAKSKLRNLRNRKSCSCEGRKQWYIKDVKQRLTELGYTYLSIDCPCGKKKHNHPIHQQKVLISFECSVCGKGSETSIQSIKVKKPCINCNKRKGNKGMNSLSEDKLNKVKKKLKSHGCKFLEWHPGATSKVSYVCSCGETIREGQYAPFRKLDKGVIKRCKNCYNQDTAKAKFIEALLSENYRFRNIDSINPSTIDKKLEYKNANHKLELTCPEGHDCEINWKSFSRGDRCRYCSTARREATCMEKYGVSNVSKLDDVKEKTKQTFIEKYGVDHPLKDPKVLEKLKQTCMEKYGVDYTFTQDWVYVKIRKESMRRYGVEYPFLSEESKQKAMETCIKKYGVKYPLQNGNCLGNHINKYFVTSEHKMPDGSIQLFQENEYQCLELLMEEGHQYDSIVYGVERVPRISYILNGDRFYFPDFYLPEENLLIELKTYKSFFGRYKKVFSTGKSCLDNGYNFELRIMEKGKLMFKATWYVEDRSMGIDEDYEYPDEKVQRKLVNYVNRLLKWEN